MRNAERDAGIPAYFKFLREPPGRQQLLPIRSYGRAIPPSKKPPPLTAATAATATRTSNLMRVPYRTITSFR
jgi:hypothetical protein